jgi:hypothetical protein
MTPTQRAAAERLADAVMHPEAAALLRELAAEPVQAPDLVRDFPAVKAAKKAAEAELGYYREMMAAEPVQAPVAWMSTYPGLPLFVTHAAHEHPQSTAVRESYTVPLYAAPQQLMRCPTDGGECGAGGYCRPEPQQRKPLSDEVVAKLINDEWATPDVPSAWKFARAIERAHGITGEPT